MSDERRFPIYRTEVLWTQDGDGPLYDRHPHDPGEGRMWNSTSWYDMNREEQDVAELERKAREEWWPEYIQNNPVTEGDPKLCDRNPADLRITVTLTHHEEWCPSWFSHWTFDDGQSDEDVMYSFGEYVHRHGFYQNWVTDDESLVAIKERGIPHRIILMGAEDRGRWCGDSSTEAPCRCETCKSHGRIGIVH